MIQKVWRHLKRYNPYSVYAAKSELKSEVSASYLTWIWWILDPVLFMLVYVFITVVVFRTEGEYLPVVVIIGLTVWNFFNKNVSISVKIVNTFKGIVSKIIHTQIHAHLRKDVCEFLQDDDLLRNRGRVHDRVWDPVSPAAALLHPAACARLHPDAGLQRDRGAFRRLCERSVQYRSGHPAVHVLSVRCLL